MITGAPPKTTGITYAGTPPFLNAKMIKIAPNAPSPPATVAPALDRIVNGFDAAVRDLPSVWRSRSVLAGVVHPRRGGGVAIAIYESYSTAVLLVQALFAVLAGLTGILVLGSIVAIARRGPIIRRLRAALPDVA